MKQLYIACHFFIASVLCGPWLYLLLAVIPKSWVNVLAPLALGTFLLAVYFSAKFIKYRSAYSGIVACIYLCAFVLPIFSRPFILKPQLEEAVRRAEALQVRLDVYKAEFGEYPHMLINLRKFDDESVINPGLGINAPGAFRYVHMDDSPDFTLTFDGTFGQVYFLRTVGWSTTGPWYSQLFGYPMQS
jgi:hypothetical protein